MMAPPRSGFLLVAAREWRWIVHDRIALFLIIGVPLIAFAVLSLTFSRAVIRDLNTVIVDADRSPTSLVFIQEIDAAPGISVHLRFGDLSAAMRAIRSGDALAAVYIPKNFEQDMREGRRPQISLFYNSQFMTPGNAASKALNDAVNGAMASVAPSLPELPSQLGSLTIEQYVLTNPALNYAQFLLRAVLPTVLHVIMAVATCYSVGSEFSRRSFRGWIRCAGGNPVTALIGKLAPLFAIFVVLMALLALVIHGGFGIPFRGDAVLIVLAAILFIVGYQGLATLLTLLVRNLALGLSCVGITCSPAFGFAGVGFPIIAMSAFAHGWGAILPLRWYIQILFDQGARGAPIHDSVFPLVVLTGLAVLFCLLALLRLMNLVHKSTEIQPLPKTRTTPPIKTSHGGFGNIVLGEIRRVVADRNIAGLMIIAPMLYAVLYPQPYIGQTLRHLPIAVVDHDRTELSRQIIMTLDADALVSVAVRTNTLAEAQQAIYGRKVFGILEIPEGTTHDVLKGVSARLPVYVDSAYFLVFSKTFQGIAEAVGTVTFDLVSHGARQDGPGASLLAAVSPISILSVPLFNPTGGYASYIVPAALVLILQQTLLMGTAMIGGVAFESGGKAARSARGSSMAVLGQGLAHLIVYLPAMFLYFVILPHLYGFSALGRLPDLFAFAATFILSVSFMGQAAGAWFKRRETAVVLFIATSLPQFFIVGVSWPVEAIPRAVRFIGHIFPSESGIDGLVRINQMGASLAEVNHDWLAIAALVVTYFILAVWGNGIRYEKSHAA